MYYHAIPIQNVCNKANTNLIEEYELFMHTRIAVLNVHIIMYIVYSGVLRKTLAADVSKIS